MQRLNSAAEMEKLREGILSQRDPDKPGIAVCAGMDCLGKDNGRIIAAFEKEIDKKKLKFKVDLRATGCHGYCEKGPLVVIYPEEICYMEVKPEDVPEIVSQTVFGKKVIDRLVYTDPESWGKAPHMSDMPFYKDQLRHLMGNSTRIDPQSIDDYLALGGYTALSKALFKMSPEEVLEEVKKAELRGRGGGGFPAGWKWKTARDAPGKEKYVIVNAHEGELGAYMDRAIFTGNPHSVLEGLTIGAYAIGSHQGFIYTRHDAPLLKNNIDKAVAKAEEYGLLGKNILGSGFDFHVEVHLDIGIFVSGESSALMRSIEGNIPEPRPKYIRTSVSGIWEKPSALNNVETWANVPLIIDKGADWYTGTGTEGSKGTKLVSLSGKIVNKGVAEVPFGTTIREIVYGIGGGIPGGKNLKAVHFGGPMGGCIPANLIDTPLDFDELAKLGAPIGAGSMLVLDEDADMIDVTRHFLQYLSDESCGKCVPCREGIRQMLRILKNISDGNGKKGDLALLEEISEVTGAASLCALGKTAADPLLSTLRYFREEYEAKINNKKRPAGKRE
jgi:NADP-reducing hydrogenase subunit HndC